MLCYSGFYGYGVKEVWDMIFDYVRFVKDNGYFEHRRAQQARYWMYETIDEHLRRSFYQNPKIKNLKGNAELEVLQNKKTSFAAAQELLCSYYQWLKETSQSSKQEQTLSL